VIRLAVIRRRKTQTVPLTGGDDFGVDWERWADGRVWKLKRKRHFGDVDPALVGKAAETAAKKMGKGVMAAKDKMVPEKYLWVQFADHKVGPGQPCPCGSRRLLRVHTNFAKCPECKALLLLSDVVEEDEDEEQGKESRATRMLRELTDVHLERRGRSDARNELYRGWGRQDDEPVFLLVELRIKPKEEQVRPEDVWERVAGVRIVPFNELDGLFDVPAEVASLWGGKPWDIVLDEIPQREEDEDELEELMSSSAEMPSGL
jgi:hypothetical protein